MPQAEFAVEHLADLTGLTEHRGEDVPLPWTDWLAEQFPGTSAEEYFDQAPSGELGMRLRRTRWIVRSQPFLWNALKVVAGVWVAATKPQLGIPDGSAALVTFLDGLGKLRETLVKLEPRELCTYTAIAMAQGVESDDILVSFHRVVKVGCAEFECPHHNGDCQATPRDLTKLADRLVQLKVVHKDTGVLRVAL